LSLVVDYVESPFERLISIHLPPKDGGGGPGAPPICQSTTHPIDFTAMNPTGQGGWWIWLGSQRASYVFFEGTYAMVAPYTCCPVLPKNFNFDFFNPVPYPADPTYDDPGYVPGGGATKVVLDIISNFGPMSTNVYRYSNIAQVVYQWTQFYFFSTGSPPIPDQVIEGNRVEVTIDPFDRVKDPTNALGTVLQIGGYIDPLLPLPPDGRLHLSVNVTHTCPPNSIRIEDTPSFVPKPVSPVRTGDAEPSPDWPPPTPDGGPRRWPPPRRWPGLLRHLASFPHPLCGECG
jgi:hypothetical protein